MKNLDIVGAFVDGDNKLQLAEIREFPMEAGKERVQMSGTYSPVTSLEWTVIVHKPRRQAYRDRYEMQRYARLLALRAVLASLLVSTFAGRRRRRKGPLHLGEMGIDDHILKKPGALPEEEFKVMKIHTAKGANILRPVTQLAEMLPGIELHS
jgi:HD-GYP domain-containing protein (c-di-GMP phosphodiesterase class II)